MSLSVETYALSKKYTNDSISGISGALAGKNCTIQSITEIEGGHRVTFQWTADNGTVRTQTMDVMDGVDGEVPAENLLKDTVGWTGKNLLKTRVGASGSIGNGTWKINSDGSITVNATLSSLGIAPWRLATGGMNPSEVLGGSDIPKGTYRIVWLNANGQKNDNIRLQIFGTNGALNTGTEIANTHTTETVTIDDTYAYYYARVWINTGTINDTMYGMLVSADISDLTYEPYHESVEEVVEQIYADNGVLGAKNLLDFNTASTTHNEVTFTNNGGIVTANGTATGGNAVFYSDMPLKAGIYTLNGTATGGQIQAYLAQSPWTNYGYDTGSGVEFTLSSDVTIRFQCIIPSGTTANNAVFKPMLRLASDPDDTYVPYAMTNRELTDAVTLKKLESTATAETKAIVVIPNNYKVAYIFVSNGTDNSTELIFVNGLTDRALRFYFTNGSSKVVKGYVWCNTSQHRFELNQLTIDDVDMSKDTNTVLTVFYV